jgi:cation:H+ antiporter
VEHLIPESLVRGLPQWQLLLVAAVAVALLCKGADWLVNGASGMAYRMGISKIIVGATIVSLGTTSPECAVSVMAAWSGEPGLALGNAIGSIIADSGLIFGLGCLVAVLPADRFVLSRQGWVQFGSGLMLALLCYAAFFLSGDAATLGRPVGLFLLALLAGYLWISVHWSRQHRRLGFSPPHVTVMEQPRTDRPLWLLLGSVALGLVVVVLASRMTIISVTELAEVHWHVPKVVIASTVVALGTSLPELAIGLTSVLRGHRELLVGNIIGADILNVLFVVGASAAAAPLPIVEQGADVPRIALYVHLPVMMAVLVLFRLFIFRASARGEFRRWYGVPLLLLYVGYAVVQYVIS